MAKFLGKFFSKAVKKSKADRAMGEEDKGVGANMLDNFQSVFPHVTPKRWLGYDAIRDDAHMLKRLFLTSINYFKYSSKDEAEEVNYESKDDYLRKEKITPTQLKKQLKRFTMYSIICYLLGTAILAYTVYILIHVSILDGIICSFFSLFVLAKGLQFSLFIRQVKSGDFKIKLKNLFGK
jgi:hypothetical protein